MRWSSIRAGTTRPRRRCPANALDVWTVLAHRQRTTRVDGGRPIISPADQPKMRYAPAFQVVMFPSSSVVMMAKATVLQKIAWPKAEVGSPGMRRDKVFKTEVRDGLGGRRASNEVGNRSPVIWGEAWDDP
ncbi:hypothetical protein [Methylobacterium gregans]|uniref:hypothetical protein n=1 Tax=Methylobacterium gregans TaxID=374424 RepID=UPI00279072F7|nr:hypothetical protein [Methylobacterium gregans]MDQ0524248.1 hypothetical protein [Methylobacterium gregans]